MHKVMIVDDNMTNLIMAKKALEDLYEIIPVSSGKIGGGADSLRGRRLRTTGRRKSGGVAKKRTRRLRPRKRGGANGAGTWRPVRRGISDFLQSRRRRRRAGALDLERECPRLRDARKGNPRGDFLLSRTRGDRPSL